MKLPTRAQQVGWVVLLAGLGVLAAVRIGCGAATAGDGWTPGAPPAALRVPEAPRGGPEW